MEEIRSRIQDFEESPIHVFHCGEEDKLLECIRDVDSKLQEDKLYSDIGGLELDVGRGSSGGSRIILKGTDLLMEPRAIVELSQLPGGRVGRALQHLVLEVLEEWSLPSTNQCEVFREFVTGFNSLYKLAVSGAEEFRQRTISVRTREDTNSVVGIRILPPVRLATSLEAATTLLESWRGKYTMAWAWYREPSLEIAMHNGHWTEAPPELSRWFFPGIVFQNDSTDRWGTKTRISLLSKEVFDNGYLVCDHRVNYTCDASYLFWESAFEKYLRSTSQAFDRKTWKDEVLWGTRQLPPLPSPSRKTVYVKRLISKLEKIGFDPSFAATVAVRLYTQNPSPSEVDYLRVLLSNQNLHNLSRREQIANLALQRIR